jgi:hypothetical protein
VTIRAGVEYANLVQAKRVIVVCLAEDRADWRRGAARWTTMRDPFCYVVGSSRYGVSEIAAWTIISPELIRDPHLIRAFSKQRFDLLLTASTLGHRIPEEIAAICSETMFHDGLSDESVA